MRVRGLDGKMVLVKPAGQRVSHGEVCVVSGQGMPQRMPGGSRGALHVTMDIRSVAETTLRVCGAAALIVGALWLLFWLASHRSDIFAAGKKWQKELLRQQRAKDLQCLKETLERCNKAGVCTMPEYCIWGVAERIQQDPPFHIIIQTFSFMQRGRVGRGVTQLTFRSKQSFGIAV